jgi:peptide/nickel transport system permease protein
LISRQPLIVSGFALVIVLATLAIFAPIISPYGVHERDWRARQVPPSAEHWFGTDDVGADVFSKVVYGSRTTIELATVIVLFAGAIGTCIGIISAYWGGAIDTVIMRVADVFLCLPPLVLAIAVIAMIGPGIQNVMLALLVVRWPVYARLARSRALVVKEQEFMGAALAIGSSWLRCVFRHMLPNMIAPVLVYATMDMGTVILVAAGLSFLGLGAGPGSAEWGRMVADGRGYFFQQPWLVFFPGAAILLSVLGFNLMGDGLRDLLDPKLRHKS